MAELSTPSEVRLDVQGRLVIPAALRKSLGFEPGDALVVRLEDGRLVLEKPETIQRRLKARFANLQPGVSLADELMAERREEAKRETAE
jgi:AbrB family looped-hinge helix DNA binding protein